MSLKLLYQIVGGIIRAIFEAAPTPNTYIKFKAIDFLHDNDFHFALTLGKINKTNTSTTLQAKLTTLNLFFSVQTNV